MTPDDEVIATLMLLGLELRTFRKIEQRAEYESYFARVTEVGEQPPAVYMFSNKKGEAPSPRFIVFPTSFTREDSLRTNTPSKVFACVQQALED